MIASAVSSTDRRHVASILAAGSRRMVCYRSRRKSQSLISPALLGPPMIGSQPICHVLSGSEQQILGGVDAEDGRAEVRHIPRPNRTLVTPWGGVAGVGRTMHTGCISPRVVGCRAGLLGGSRVAVSEAPDVDERFLPTGDEAGTAPEDRRFRPDIEGCGRSPSSGVLYHAVPWLIGRVRRGRRVFRHFRFRHHGGPAPGAGRNGRDQPPGFYARRARRILPAASVVIIVTSSISYWLGFIAGDQVSADAKTAGSFFANFHFISPRHQLFHRHSAALASPAFLVPGRRGAVLLRVPGHLPRGGPLGSGSPRP